MTEKVTDGDLEDDEEPAKEEDEEEGEEETADDTAAKSGPAAAAARNKADVIPKESDLPEVEAIEKEEEEKEA